MTSAALVRGTNVRRMLTDKEGTVMTTLALRLDKTMINNPRLVRPLHWHSVMASAARTCRLNMLRAFSRRLCAIVAT